MPTVRPSIRPKPVTMLAAWAGCSSKNSPLVDHLFDQLVHIVGRGRAGRDQGVEAGLLPVPRVGRGSLGHAHAVGRRQQADELARGEQRLDVVVERHVGHARFRGVGDGSAQLFLRDHLVGDRLDHIGAGHEHVRAVLHHEDEVRHGRRIDRPASARPHDERELRGRRRRPARFAGTPRHSRRAKPRPPGCARHRSRSGR